MNNFVEELVVSRKDQPRRKIKKDTDGENSNAYIFNINHSIIF